jgi:hypothetical protein
MWFWSLQIKERNGALAHTTLRSGPENVNALVVKTRQDMFLSFFPQIAKSNEAPYKLCQW